MEKPRKRPALAAAALSALAWAAAAIGLWSASEESGAPVAGTAMVLLIMLALALAAIVAGVAGRSEAERKSARLSAAGRASYAAIVDEFRASALSPGERRGIANEVLDFLITAESEGRTAVDVTGPDPATFARKAIEALGARRSPIAIVCESIQFFLGMVAGLQLAAAVRAPGGSFFEAGLGVSTICFLGLVSLALPALKALSRSSMKHTRAPRQRLIPLLGIPLALGAAYIGGMELLRTGPYGGSGFGDFLRHEAIPFPDAWTLGLAAFLFSGAWIVRRLATGRSLGKAIE